MDNETQTKAWPDRSGHGVAVLDRDPTRSGALVTQLSLDGYAVSGAASVERARMLAGRSELLCLGRSESGVAATLALLREIRSGDVAHADRSTPVIVLADGEAEFISALRAEATMVLPHMSSPLVISHAADRALTLRDEEVADVMQIGALTVDTTQQRVSVHGKEVPLSDLQSSVLSTMAAAPGRVFSRDELFKEVFGYTQPKGSRALNQHLHRFGQPLCSARRNRDVERPWSRLHHDRPRHKSMTMIQPFALTEISPALSSGISP